MEKRKIISVISMMFILLMIIRMIEIIFVKTDQTWIGENILHKICCILLVWIALDILRLHWGDLGFSKKRGICWFEIRSCSWHKYLFSFLRYRIYCTVCNGETPVFSILYYKFFTCTGTYKG